MTGTEDCVCNVDRSDSMYVVLRDSFGNDIRSGEICVGYAIGRVCSAGFVGRTTHTPHK